MKLIDMSVADFTNEVDSNSPAPGGGSVSALASDIGGSLARMMAHLSFEKKKFEQLDEKTKEEFKARFDKLGEIRKELSTLVDKDTESFNEFMKAVKMPKETEEQNQLRAKAIQEATIFSIEVPYKTASLSLEALRLLDFLIKNGNQNAITDIGVGTLMLSAGMEGAILNVKVNLGQIKDKQIYDKYRDGCKEILSEGNEIKDNIISNIHKQLD